MCMAKTNIMKLDIIGQRLRRVRKLLGITRKEIQDKYNFPANTIKVMTSCIIFNCAAENLAWPMRLAGTWKQYSAKAISQLTRITFHIADCLNFKWPYHAKVIKTFEIVSRMIVFISGLSKSPARHWIQARPSRRRLDVCLSRIGKDRGLAYDTAPSLPPDA